VYIIAFHKLYRAIPRQIVVEVNDVGSAAPAWPTESCATLCAGLYKIDHFSPPAAFIDRTITSCSVRLPF
jgi:hypothetical protein